MNVDVNDDVEVNCKAAAFVRSCETYLHARGRDGCINADENDGGDPSSIAMRPKCWRG